MPHHIPFECMVGCNSVFLLYNDLAEFFTACVNHHVQFIYLFIYFNTSISENGMPMPTSVFLVLEMSPEILCSAMRSLNTLGKFQVFTNTGTSDEVADYVIFLDHII